MRRRGGVTESYPGSSIHKEQIVYLFHSNISHLKLVYTVVSVSDLFHCHSSVFDQILSQRAILCTLSWSRVSYILQTPRNETRKHVKFYLTSVDREVLVTFLWKILHDWLIFYICGKIKLDLLVDTLEFNFITFFY